MKRDGRLVWIDLEMTGLDPDKERIIEIAAVITEADLSVVAEGPDLVINQPAQLLESMDRWNTEHHGGSGLTDAVRASTITEAEAEEQVLEFISLHCAKRKAPLAGNSIHVDRFFIARYMRDLDAFLHYRNVDVSTIKELASRWYPSLYAKRPRKTGAHRAKDDILESIAELAYYRSALFAQAPTPLL